ncbi:ubiquitin carboxyl-terminal hydrolase 17 [Forsythia ovata]|uniref:Ubiquitin carboxyl-terminal hydrolase 17 n=1 Tax=Forsythia ovata TaxID=205694 RepID=A0ABD1RMK1_9LAMI
MKNDEALSRPLVGSSRNRIRSCVRISTAMLNPFLSQPPMPPIRQKWKNATAKREEILRLVTMASEEEAEIADIKSVEEYKPSPLPPPLRLEKRYYCAVVVPQVHLRFLFRGRGDDGGLCYMFGEILAVAPSRECGDIQERSGAGDAITGPAEVELKSRQDHFAASSSVGFLP